MSTAHVITENGYQIVRLPKEFYLEGAEVAVKRIGRSLLLVPRDVNRWDMLTSSLGQFTEDYLQDRAQPAEQVRNLPSE